MQGENIAPLTFDYTIQDADPTPNGDTSQAVLTIQIQDDIPVAEDDVITSPADPMVGDDITGNLLADNGNGADMIGADTAGARITSITFGGVTQAIPAGGSTTFTGVAGTFGDLTVDDQGNFTYTITGVPAQGVADSFSYVLTDGDGDNDEATVTLSFAPGAQNDTPAAPGDPGFVAEDVNPDGSFKQVSTSGNVLANDNFGTDGPGVPPIVDVDFGTGNPNGVTKDDSVAGQITFTDDEGVWTLVLLTDGPNAGDYTFTLNERFEHDPVAGMNVNDLTFTYTIQDGDPTPDGDTSQATLTIRIQDDVPTANDDVGAIVEPEQGDSVSGNVVLGDSGGGVADDGGADLEEAPAVPTPVTAIATPSSGFLSVPQNGTVTSIQGTFGLLEIDNTGEYTYTINRPLTPGQAIDESFSYRIVDADGDTSTATLTIDFKPDARDDGDPDPNDEASLVVEDGSADGLTFFPDSFSDNLLTNDIQGSDGLATQPITAIEWTGNYVGGVVDDTPALDTATNTFTVESNDGVWTLVVDALTGDYTFTLKGPYDHDANDSNGSGVFDVQTFNYTVEDADGDSDTAQLTVGIKDDTPSAIDDVAQVTAGSTVTMVINMDVSGSMGFDFAGNNPPVGETRLDAAVEAVKQALEAFVDAGFGPTTQVRFQPFNNAFPLGGLRAPGEFDPSDLAGYTAGGTNAINTYLDGLFAEGATQYESVMNEAAQFLSNPANQSDFNLLYHVSDGADNDGFDPDFGVIDQLYDGSIPDLEIFAFGLGTSGASNVDFDQLDTVVTGIEPGDPGNVIGDKDDADPSNDENPDNVALAQSGTDLEDLFLDTLPTAEVTGDVLDNDDQGGDTGTVTQISFDGTVRPVPDAAGDPASTEIDGDFGTLVIFPDGTFTYNANVPGPTNGGVDEFDYVLTDEDGDTSEATLTIVINTPIVTLDDGPGTNNDPGLVIEDGPGDGTFTPTSISDNVLQNDSPGSVPFAAQPIVGLAFTGSYPVDPVVFDPTAQTFTIDSTDDTWTLVVDAVSGDYTFSLNDRFEHQDIDGPNVDLSLTFNYTVEDQGGTQSTAQLRIGIEDDIPVALDDIDSIGTGTNTTSGNVLDNDDQGGDGASVTGFSGAGGSGAAGATVAGTFGDLTLNANGSYDYVLRGPAQPGGGSDIFSYTIEDEDGDASTATLTITIDSPPTARPDGPGTDNDAGLVVEDGPGDGTFTQATLVDNVLDNDVPGSNPLADMPISAVDYTGSATYLPGDESNPANQIFRTDLANSVVFDFIPDGPGGSAVWTIEIFTKDVGPGPNDTKAGTYFFVLREPFEHADIAGNNTFDETFDYTIIDTEGGTSSATLTVRIEDDVPLAVDDDETLSGTVQAGSTVGGNVLDNDDQGGDGATVTMVDGQEVNQTGDTIIIGQFGTLTIDANGVFTYEVTDPNQPDGPSEAFVYEITDSDGDISTATLTIGTGLNTRDDGFQTDNDPGFSVENGPGDGSFTPDSIGGNVLVNDQLGTQPLMDPPISDVIYSGTGAQAPNVVRTATADGFVFEYRLDTGDPSSAVWRMEIFTRDDTSPSNAFQAGDYTFDLLQRFDHTLNPGEDLVAFETFSYSVENADGSESDSATLTIGILDDTPVAVNDEAGVAQGETSVEGNVVTNDDQGGDGALVSNVEGLVTPTDPLDTSKIQVLGTFGVLSISNDGNYTYTITADPSVIPQNGVTETFSYTLTDSDGDSSVAILAIGNDPDAKDDNPTVNPDDTRVFESDDPAGSGVFDPTSVSGNVLDNDVRGSEPLANPPIIEVLYTGSDSFSRSGSAATGFTFTETNGVWRLEIDTATGDYTFFLDKRFQHPDADGENSVLQDFDYTISTESGEVSDTATLTIEIVDDVPNAVSDEAQLDGNATNVTGNVLDNDDQGGDGATVIGVTGFQNSSGGFGDTVRGEFGEVVIQANGDFFYAVTVDPATIPPSGVSETFTYTITDADGDVSTALLTVGTGLDARDDGPGTDNDAGLVIENGLPNGTFQPTSLSDNLLDNDTLGTDPPADPRITAMSYTGSDNVTPQTTATAFIFTQDDGIWRLEVDRDTGEYTFFLDQRFPHTGGNNGENIALETFSYTIADIDGDSDSAILTVGIQDDVPVAIDDMANLAAGNLSVDGNVRDNDDQGGDSALVTAVEGQGTSGGPITVKGTFGDLLIDENGQFTYTVTVDPATLPDTGAQETFDYTLTDADGDVSNATLNIGTDPDARNDNPTVNPDDTRVFESDDPAGSGVFDPTSVSGNVLDNDVRGSEPLADPPIINVLYNGSDSVTRTGNAASGFTFTENDGVWRLVIDTTTGDYTFFLDQPFDHPDGMAANSVFQDFDYTISTESMEVSDTATLTIEIVDDVPIAVNDMEEIDGLSPVSGNVRDNDDQGGDGATVTNVVGFNNSSGGSGDSVNGEFGQVVIQSNGDFLYTVTVDPATIPTTGITESFTYTLTDADGDVSTAVLTLETGLDARDDNPDNNPQETIVFENDAPMGSGFFDPTGVQGNVLDNDTVGSDGFGDPNITDFSFLGGNPNGVSEQPSGNPNSILLVDDLGVW